MGTTKVDATTVAKIKEDVDKANDIIPILQTNIANLNKIDTSTLATQQSVTDLTTQIASAKTLIDSATANIIAIQTSDAKTNTDLTAAIASIAAANNAIATINTTLTSMKATLTSLITTTTPTTAVPTVTMSNFRSAGVDVKVNGVGQFAVVVTLYGVDIVKNKVTIEGAEIAAQYLNGQSIIETVGDSYPISPDTYITGPGGTDNHTHTVDLGDAKVYAPAFMLSGKGNQLILFITPTSMAWVNGDILKIKFNDIVINQATADIGMYR
jgi:hypothetical protein